MFDFDNDFDKRFEETSKLIHKTGKIAVVFAIIFKGAIVAAILAGVVYLFAR